MINEKIETLLLFYKINRSIIRKLQKENNEILFKIERMRENETSKNNDY